MALMRLLRRIAAGGAVREAELARELGVTVGLVQQMLGDLAQRGYLRRRCSVVDEASCGSCCAEHSDSAGADCGQLGAMWELTDKGKQAVATGRAE